MAEFIQPYESKFEPKKYQRETNPATYLQSFESSPIFQNQFNQYYQEILERNPNCPVEKATQTFWGLQRNIDALWQYFKKEKRLVYDKDQYPDTINLALANYWTKIRAIKIKERLQRLDQDTLEELDYERMLAHGNAARAFEEEGICPDFQIGKTLVHFLTIDQGLDIIDSERERKRLLFYRKKGGL